MRELGAHIPRDNPNLGPLGLAYVDHKAGDVAFILLEFPNARTARVAQQNLEQCLACRLLDGVKAYMVLSVKQLPGPTDVLEMKQEPGDSDGEGPVSGPPPEESGNAGDERAAPNPMPDLVAYVEPRERRRPRGTGTTTVDRPAGAILTGGTGVEYVESSDEEKEDDEIKRERDLWVSNAHRCVEEEVWKGGV